MWRGHWRETFRGKNFVLPVKQNDYDHNCFEKCSKRKCKKYFNRENVSSQFGNIYIHVSDGKTYTQMVSEGDKMPPLWDLNPRRPQS